MDVQAVRDASAISDDDLKTSIVNIIHLMLPGAQRNAEHYQNNLAKSPTMQEGLVINLL